MPRRRAIDIALDAAGKPGSASLLAVAPLPDGLKDVLRIVAEGEWRSAATEAAYATHSSEAIRAASASFLKVALFEKPASPYRVLGLSQGAGEDEVRENKRLLLKWLHPDRNPRPEERALLARVIEAAEAIEGGHGKFTTATVKASPGPSGENRRGPAPQRPAQAPAFRPVAKPSGAPRHARPVSQRRHIATRGVTLVARLVKLSALTAVVGIGGLVAWRMTMHEPIGVSLARYSKLALGAVTW